MPTGTKHCKALPNPWLTLSGTVLSLMLLALSFGVPQAHGAELAPKTAVSTLAPNTCVELPAALRRTLKTVDSRVRLRGDCLAVLANGHGYIAVMPQHAGSAVPSRELQRWPAKAAEPDVLAFDEGWYLLRLVPSVSGKWTFGRLPNYPDGLKQGILPQNFVLPAGLSIPVELRIILGDLPYETPVISAEGSPLWVPENSLVLGNDGQLISQQEALALQEPSLYLSQLESAQWWQVDWSTGTVRRQAFLKTLFSSLLVAEDQRLWVNSLNRPELLRLHGPSQLVQSRVELPAPAKTLIALGKPNTYALALLQQKPQVVLVDLARQRMAGSITLPGMGVAAAAHPRLGLAYVSLPDDASVVELDTLQQKARRQWLPQQLPFAPNGGKVVRTALGPLTVEQPTPTPPAVKPLPPKTPWLGWPWRKPTTGTTVAGTPTTLPKAKWWAKKTKPTGPKLPTLGPATALWVEDAPEPLRGEQLGSLWSLHPQGNTLLAQNLLQRYVEHVVTVPEGSTQLLSQEAGALWVFSPASSTLVRVALDTGLVTQTLELEGEPTAVALAPGQQQVVVANAANKSLDVYSSKDGRLLQRYALNLRTAFMLLVE